MQAVPRLAGAKPNGFLAALPPQDLALLVSHLRMVPLERGAVLQESGDSIEHVYFPHSGMVSIVAIMASGTTVETMTIGRAGVVGATAGLGSRRALGRAVVQISGAATRLPSPQFQSAAAGSQAIRELAVRYNDLVIMQTQQSVACNALHPLEARLSRWLLQSHDCADGDTVRLTQELLGQMLGVRRTSVTLAARLLQGAGMIRYRRGLVQVVDRAALEETACECYAAVKRSIDEVFPPPHNNVA
jgi:CRP-like cAMP-binding protein